MLIRDSQQPNYPVVEVALNAIAKWVYKYRNTLGLANQRGQCGPDDVMQIARDLGAPANQLREILKKGPGATVEQKAQPSQH